MTIQTAPILKFLGAVVLLGAVSFGGLYVLQNHAAEAACASPIVYTIGDIDPRFGVSREEMKEVLEDAAALWNHAAGKTVFEFGEEGTLPVRLMYDERQATTELGGVISQEQAAYDLKKVEVDRLMSEYERQTRAYEAMGATYEREKSAYEEEVAGWNRQGGAPSAQYQKLEERRLALERSRVQITSEADRLNEMVDDINAAVKELNSLAEHVNKTVNVFNKLAGNDFDQGRYVRDEEGTRITIYEFENRAQLLRALAHEFGHALGIEHTKSPQSLMYPYNSGKSLALTSEDVEALKQACDL